MSEQQVNEVQLDRYQVVAITELQRRIAATEGTVRGLREALAALLEVAVLTAGGDLNGEWKLDRDRLARVERPPPPGPAVN